MPEATILSPADGSTVAISQTVAFEATAYDVDTGEMPPEQLTWTSSLDGALGQGDSLSLADLSVGQHTITFTADDGAGGVAQDSIVLNVLADPAELEAEDGLMISPATLYFYPDRGQTMAALTIENQNAARAIGWSATWNVSWLSLDTNHGTTPDEITVQCALDAGAPQGVYTGEIAFTSPDMPGQTWRVLVEAVIERRASAPADFDAPVSRVYALPPTAPAHWRGRWEVFCIRIPSHDTTYT